MKECLWIRSTGFLVYLVYFPRSDEGPAIFFCESKIPVKKMHMPDMAFPRVVFPEKNLQFIYLSEKALGLISIGYCS